MDMNIAMPSGYRLLANYKNLVVLAEAKNKETPEPFVTWLVLNGSDVQQGEYFASFEKAEFSFFERSCPKSAAPALLQYSSTAADIAATMKSVRAAGTLQKVNRRGIYYNGKWYCSNALLMGYLGTDVTVERNDGILFVFSWNGEPIDVFIL